MTYFVNLTSNACDSRLWDTIEANSIQEALGILKKRVSFEEEDYFTLTHREGENFWEYTVS